MKKYVEHVCGLQGYNPMIDPECPGCVSRRSGAKKQVQEKPVTAAPPPDMDPRTGLTPKRPKDE